jgi:hypothetical protein
MKRSAIRATALFTFVIARSEATKQSSFLCRGDKAGLLRFARNDGRNPVRDFNHLLKVVPAKAGTHTPRRVF